MRAAQIATLDGPSALRVTDVDEPHPSEDVVVVEVHAAGVTFPDASQTRGLYQYKPELPFVPGTEVAGVVRSAPDGASRASGRSGWPRFPAWAVSPKPWRYRPMPCSPSPTGCSSCRPPRCP